MKLIKIIFQSVFIFHLSAAIAAEPAKKTPSPKAKIIKQWAQEPKSFAGLSFEDKIEKIPTCPHKQIEGLPSSYKIDHNKWEEIIKSDPTIIGCINFTISFPDGLPPEDLWDRKNDEYSLLLPRDIKPFYNLSINANQKKIVKLNTKFESNSFSEVEAIAFEKFGKPHKILNEKLQTNGGALFPVSIYVWHGNIVTITLHQMATRYYDSYFNQMREIGFLLIENNEFSAFNKKLQDEKIKNKASNF